MEKTVDPRMHSAEHILTGALVRMFGIGRPFTTHLEKKKSKADYAFGRALTDEEVRNVEAAVLEVIRRDLPVREDFLTKGEAAQQFDLQRLPDEAGDQVRIVRIGDFDACPCIGPHVSSTADIGEFRIISTSWDDGALRVRFKLSRE
jgi:Ser-tRNA(Ala) deacylase AlaX